MTTESREERAREKSGDSNTARNCLGEGALCLYRENKQVSGKREERGPLKYLTNTHE